MKKRRITAMILTGCMIFSAGVFAQNNMQLSEKAVEMVEDSVLSDEIVTNEETATGKQEESKNERDELILDDPMEQEKAARKKETALEVLAGNTEMSTQTQSSNKDYVSITELGREYYDQTIQQYAELEEGMGDPQYITDEEFFGVYDASTQSWTTESKFAYEMFSGLRPVEEAVRAGDYALAKQELRQYYITKFAGTELMPDPITDANAVKRAQAMFENLQVSSTIVDFLKLTDEFNNFTINVTDSVKKSLGTKMAFSLVALKKDGYQGVFYSKEAADFQPYLEATVNGRKRQYAPVADAYIKAGADKNSNFGLEDTLLVEESYSSIGSIDRTDYFTHRSYILFDFSDINAGDKVTDARLYLNGKMVASLNPSTPGEERNFKDIAILESNYLTMTDESAAWSKATDVANTISFDREYSVDTVGLEAKMGVFSELSNVANGKEENAYKYAAVRALHGFLIKEMTPGRMEAIRTLTINGNAASFIYQVASIADNPYMTPERFTFLLKYCYKLADLCVNSKWEYTEENGNWGTVAAAGAMISGLVWQEFRDAHLPLDDKPHYSNAPASKGGGWLAVGEYRLAYNLEKELRPDGSSVEGPYAYVEYVLNQVLRCFVVTEKMHIDMKQYLSEETLNRIAQNFVYMTNMSTPLELTSEWQQGQGAGPYTNPVYDRYGEILDQLDDPFLNWARSGRKIGEPPPYLSYAYDFRRNAVLRSDWSANAMAAQINADGAQVTHGQVDDLGLNVYAYGKMLLADPMTDGYNVTGNYVTAWLHTSRAHNLVEINGMNQKPGSTKWTITNPDGEEETWENAEGTAERGSLHPENREFNPIYNYIKAETKNYQNTKNMNDNFTMWRDVLFIEPEYFIVTDYIEPQKNKSAINTYRQYWHTVPDAHMTVDEETGIASTHFVTGPNITVAPVKGNILFNQKKMTGWYRNPNTFADYVRYTKQTAGTATFHTVLYPTRAGDTVAIQPEAIPLDIDESKGGAFKFTTSGDDEKDVSYYTLYDESLRKDRSFGDYTTDGTLSLVQKKYGEYDMALLRNGTFLADKDGHMLIQSKSYVPDVGIQWNGSELSIATEERILSESLAGVSEAPETENIALGKDVDSCKYYDYSSPEYAVDGKMDTCWTSAAGENPWLNVVLENIYEVGKVAIYDDCEDIEYTIKYSKDGQTWNTAEVTDKTVEEADRRYRKTYKIAPKTAKFVMVTANGGENLSVYELEVYPEKENNRISLSDLSIYAPQKVSRVLLNGESVPFKKSNGQIVFTDTSNSGGGGDSGDIEEPDDKPSGGKPSHGSGGGGSVTGGNGNVIEPTTPISPVEPEKKPFKDELKGHWAEKEITQLLEKGVVTGNGETLALTAPVTRAEFAALLIRTLRQETLAYKNEFGDVAGDEWYAPYLATAYHNGIMQGDGQNVNPEKNITREEMAKMLVSAYEFLYSAEEMPNGSFRYTDLKEISPWAVSYVEKATALGLMNGMEDGSFQPKEAVLREQAFVTMYRLIDVQYVKKLCCALMIEI